MLDSDVARLFEYATKDLNRNAKNNIERFPEYYCFQLTNISITFLQGYVKISYFNYKYEILCYTIYTVD